MRNCDYIQNVYLTVRTGLYSRNIPHLYHAYALSLPYTTVVCFVKLKKPATDNREKVSQKPTSTYFYYYFGFKPTDSKMENFAKQLP